MLQDISNLNLNLGQQVANETLGYSFCNCTQYVSKWLSHLPASYYSPSKCSEDSPKGVPDSLKCLKRRVVSVQFSVFPEFLTFNKGFICQVCRPQ